MTSADPTGRTGAADPTDRDDAGPIRVRHVALPPSVGARLDPRTLLGLAPPGAPRFFWAAPDDPVAVAAYGAACRIAAAGPDRLAVAKRRCAAVRLDTHGEIPQAAGAPPHRMRFLGGFAFGDAVDPTGAWGGFPPALFVLPAVTLTCRGHDAWLTLTAPAGETEADELGARARAIAHRLAAAADAGIAPERPPAPPPAVPELDAADPALVERIARVVAAIRRGEARKVVLATAWSTPAAAARDPLGVLDRLRRAQPGCFHVLVQPGGVGVDGAAGGQGDAPRPPAAGAAFVVASPERLVAVRGGRVATMALAGSARRDPDPAADHALGVALLGSAKDRAEHAMVVEAIAGTLGRLGVDARFPPQPRLRRLATVQHLETPFEGAGPDGLDVLDAAAALHPTPALGGVPRAAALALLRAAEGFDRGWYAGAVGWIDGCGDGDVAVGIRGLLLRGDVATAFAGAGLVAASDPAAEAREIALKLRAALSGLA